jgi:aldehyde dehydrogenase (NAD+)
MIISDNIGRFYINGEWVTPSSGASVLDVINPATEASVAKVRHWHAR